MAIKTLEDILEFMRIYAVSLHTMATIVLKKNCLQMTIQILNETRRRFVDSVFFNAYYSNNI